MVDQGYISQFFKKAGLWIILGTLPGMISASFFLDRLLIMQDSSIIIVIGLIYVLITIITLINVFMYYNATEKAVANENEALISLWVNTDYLDQPKISQMMKTSLIDYLDKTTNIEFKGLKSFENVNFPSNEFIQISKVIDQIRLVHPRDTVAFQAMVQAFKDLSRARNSRIYNSQNRLPSILKRFYLFISVIFYLIFLIKMMESIYLYLFILIIVVVFVVFSYLFIIELDNSLEGLFALSLDRYYETKEFIEAIDHDVFTT
jgi:hypothetical protein